MMKGWEKKIEAAQSILTVNIDGKPYPRTKYGDEVPSWRADEFDCHDCAVVKGQYHVPGCDVERCPKCKGQLISCRCDVVGDMRGLWEI